MSTTDNHLLFRNRFQRVYVILIALFAVLMVLTNIIGTKLFALFPDLLPTGFGSLSGYGPVILTTGLLTYPLTFLCTDIASELYGHKRANVMVLIGFFASLLMLGVVHIAVNVTPADRYWADASNNMLAGARLQSEASMNDSTMSLPHANGLLPNGTCAALTNNGSSPLLLPYTELRNTAANNTYADFQLTLQTPLPQTLPAHTWIVPAIPVQATEGGLTLTLQLGMPTSGQVLLNNKAYSYDTNLQINEVPADILAAPPIHAALIHQLDASGMQTAFEATFASPSILLFASMLAYLFAQFLDVSLYHFWRRVTKGRWMWIRNNGSTAISQLADTIIVNGIFLPVAFGMSFTATCEVIIAIYLCKLVLAALDTPLIYASVALLKRHLGLAFTEEIPTWMNE